MATSPTWLITGASNGFGLLLTLKALAAGHQVIATVRSRARSADAVQSIENAGGHIIEMDLTESQQSIVGKVRQAEKIYGKIDILVNNAGYSALGAVEFFTDEQATHQFRANLFGPLFTIQGVLPGFRSRRSGTIVNISSVAGQDGLATCGLYSGSKFALEGLSESLAREVSEFGISVLIVEPGAFRTSFLRESQFREPLEPLAKNGYEGSAVEVMLKKFREAAGKQVGDPKKAVDAIFETITGEGKVGYLKGRVFRLVLGEDAFTRIQAKLNSVQKDIDTAREVAHSTALDA